MNSDSNRSDLRALKNELERVEMDVRFLRVKADQLEQRIAAAEVATTVTAATAARTTPHQPPPIPPPLPAFVPPPPEPPPIVQEAPPIIEQVIAPTPAPQPEREPVLAIESQFTPPAAAPAPEPVSLEMRLGTYWFVRIGIVMILTAMVFLGNYAYHHIIHRIGPAAKIAMLYLASGALLGLGAWLPRKQEQLKNYAEVLFAGGLAAVYFTTYAAHHFPNLQIIASALLDGVLLLVWTSFIVWIADRKKSEVLAVFAIGLAYYTATITNVGAFTLTSNLLLAAAAVFFLVRNRWVSLTFLSLLASYGSYGYWRYYAHTPGIDAAFARMALIGYWAIFTAAVFLTRNAEFAGTRRASFLSFNNGAAFALLALSMVDAHSGNLWKLSLGFGATLLALAVAARLVLKDDELPRRAYLAQGLLLTTLGIILKLSGPTLALVLAMESAMLVIFSTQWKSRFLRNAAVLIGGLATCWFVGSLEHTHGAPGWWKAAGIFALFLFNAAWTGRHSEESSPTDFRALPCWYTLLALLAWGVAVFSLAPAEMIGLILSLTGLALTATIYTVRVREITLLSQGLVAVAQAQTILLLLQSTPQIIWSPVAVVLSSIALSLWWKKQTALELDPSAGLFVQVISALAAASILYIWLPREFAGDNWIYAAVTLTLAWTAFAAWMRSAPLAAAGQLFLLGTSAMTFFRLIDKGTPATQYVVALIFGFVALAAMPRLFKIQNNTLLVFADTYQWLASALAVACVVVHADPSNRFLILSVLSAASILAALFGARSTFGPGIALALAGLACWIPTWQNSASGAESQNALAILILAGLQVLLRRRPGPISIPEEAQGAWVMAGAAAFWIYVSRWVVVHSSGAHFYLTASWALLAFAFFIAGFTLRERSYRWAALVVLGCALGRVVLLDVWQLQTLYRILSFLALGFVLLALGYFYTRYQKKIAQWL